MHKVWAYVIDIFIGILIIFVSVTIYFSLRTETVMKSMYKSASEELVTSTKRNGLITIDDYENYMERMGIGNSLFEISFEHRYKIFEPEYRFKTLEEIIEDQNREYGGSNNYHYREVVTERPHVDDPINDGNLNTETNESILSKAVDTPADPSHVHGDDCYNGDKHIHTGNSSSGGGCYGFYKPGGTCGRSLTFSHYSEGTLSFMCPSSGCEGTCTGWYFYEIYKCSEGHTTSRTLVWTWRCSYCDSSLDNPMQSIPTKCSSQTSGRYEINCGKTEGRYYDDNGNEVNPVCDRIILSLTPTHTNQTVYTNDSLITTARAVFKDGSERTVVCTTNFSTATPGVNKTATLTYSYTIDGTEHNKTCTVTVTVIPRSNTCPKGHIYNLNEDGTDPGCPYCRVWIDNLRVINPTTSPIVITIGTTLIQNHVRLLATYMDGHTEEVSSGYIDNLDSAYLGTKPVTIGYKGASVTVMVTTVCATMICDICGYEYNLYPDGSNPGCPRCIQKIPVFTGNIMEYEHINHTEEILEELYINGQYNFNVNDTFSISVSNKSGNLARKLLNKVYPSLREKWFVIEKSEYIMSK